MVLSTVSGLKENKKMRKRIIAIIICIVVLVTSSCQHVTLSQELVSEVQNPYLLQMLFGNRASQYKSNEKAQMLLSALFLCCGHYKEEGQDVVNYLKSKGVSRIPNYNDISISEREELLKCVCSSWDNSVYDITDKKIRSARKNIIINTVKKIFTFSKTDPSAEQFAKLLYYLDILSVYYSCYELDKTGVSFNRYSVPPYTGNPTIQLNGNIPVFTENQKRAAEPFYTPLNEKKLCGVVYAVIGEETLSPPGSRDEAAIRSILPPGIEKQFAYEDIPGCKQNIYSRCHLLAHQLFIGTDRETNLITGTTYFNEYGMKPYEDKVAAYVKGTGNHVLYKVTPVYVGNNSIASGVQMEAYSVEDNGSGICFNIYCYNVLPGIGINYENGASYKKDELAGNDWTLPFSLFGADKNHIDFIYEMEACLNAVFSNNLTSNKFIGMKDELSKIAIAARALNPKKVSDYDELQKYEYDYMNTLINYLPMLLQDCGFFSQALN